ncbi:hypothetical protein GDO78_004017 [Eleutherodactylus coqui]|uniref:Uncharacterized protein n=1 Tax=Eleutherodactylus coqui TaxID=57060 RepID=A0A8J6EPR0_ELECQ|nr:hypothetical protein GDO78_004017 [Eleutherodactylus coqui]
MGFAKYGAITHLLPGCSSAFFRVSSWILYLPKIGACMGTVILEKESFSPLVWFVTGQKRQTQYFPLLPFLPVLSPFCRFESISSPATTQIGCPHQACRYLYSAGCTCSRARAVSSLIDTPLLNFFCLPSNNEG